jgi:peptidoglycan/LPS O-acetylase OafA/YrhL
MTKITIKKYNNLSNLDLLRSIAIFLVVISHIPIKFPHFLPQGQLGLLGVMIFFVHTSFVLMKSLSRINYKNKFNFFFKFYIQRIFRVYPLSIFAVLIFFSINYYFLNFFNLKDFLSNIFLIQNITQNTSYPQPLWSLPYEVQMYLFLPLIFLLTKNSTKKIIILYIFTIIIVLIFKIVDKNKFYYDLIHFFPCFLAGVISYAFFKKKNQKFSIIYLMIYLFTSIILFPFLFTKNIPENLLGTIFCLPLALLISFTQEIRFKMINNITKKIAKYSYCIYLFHPLAIKILIDWQIKFWIKIPIVMIGVVLLCYIVYNLIEKPAIKLGKELSHNL